MKSVHLATAVALLVLALPAASGAREPVRFSRWPDDTALTLTPHRVVLGLFSEGGWGLHPNVDLRLHPLLFWALPHVEAKLRWLDAGHWQVSSAHRLSIPTPFLALVSREGSGGLLPPTTDVPLAASFDNDLIGSFEWSHAQWVTLRAGAAFALVGPGDATLLDFPILYQRFAELYAPLVPKLSVSASGSLFERFAYAVEFRHYWLPLDDLPLYQASEYSAQGYLQISDNHRLGAAGLISVARLPVGRRTHFLPYLDYQFAF